MQAETKVIPTPLDILLDRPGPSQAQQCRLEDQERDLHPNVSHHVIVPIAVLGANLQC